MRAFSASPSAWSHRRTCEPARAKLIAQARPMKPEPMMAVAGLSESFDIAVYPKRLSRNIDARIRQEERHHAGDVIGADHAPHRHTLEIAIFHLIKSDADLPGAIGDHFLHARPLYHTGKDGI